MLIFFLSLADKLLHIDTLKLNLTRSKPKMWEQMKSMSEEQQN